MKAFSGADRFNSLHKRHTHTPQEPLKKGVGGKGLLRSPQEIKLEWHILADLRPSKRMS